MQEDSRQTYVNWIDGVSYLLMGIMLIYVLLLNLLMGFIAGLIVYHSVYSLASLLAKWLPGCRSRLVALIVLAMVIIACLVSLTLFVITKIKSGTVQVDILLHKLMAIIDHIREQLPDWANQYFPDSIEDVRNTLGGGIHQHIRELQLMGKEAARGLTHILIGMILGAIIAIDSSDHNYHRPLAAALLARTECLADSFRRIILAQVKISGINTILTGSFLLVILPFFNVYVPFAKTLILITFIVCLLPVVGNLISNTLIAFVTISISLPVTIFVLGYLILIHKIEYILNARIVGNEVKAKTWELLIAMLVMESAFGLVGVIAAPIYYSYLKRELEKKCLV